MGLTDPFPVNSQVADASEVRLANTAIWASAGVVPFSKPNDPTAMPTLFTAGASMTPAVADFTLVFARTYANKFPNDGYSALRNVGSSGVPAIPTAPSTGSRIDRIVVRVNDTLKGDGTTAAQFLIRTGTATTGDPSTTMGALLTGDIELARVTVPAGVTALNAAGVVITHVYTAASLVGGTRYVRSVTELLAITNAYNTNTNAIDISTGRQYTWSEIHDEWVLSWLPAVMRLWDDVPGNISVASGQQVNSRSSFVVAAPTRMKARYIFRGQVGGQSGSTATTWRMYVNGLQIGNDVRWQNGGQATPLLMLFEFDLVLGNNTVDIRIGTDSASTTLSIDNIRRELYGV